MLIMNLKNLQTGACFFAGHSNGDEMTICYETTAPTKKAHNNIKLDCMSSACHVSSNY